ncbi:MAG: hypothetical protein ACON4E_02305 [Flavobacteriales bacterium]
MRATIERLHNKITQLAAKYNETKEQYTLSLSHIEQLKEQLNIQSENLRHLEEKNKILKLSTSIQGEKEDNKAARKKINELVREIDKCIALLNK